MRSHHFNIALSICLHAAFFAIFLPNSASTNKTISLNNIVIVDLTNLPRSEKSLSRHSNHSNENNRSFSLSALSPINKPHLSNPLVPGQNRGVLDEMSAYSGSIDSLLLEKPETYGAYTWAHRKLQYGLGYPEAFRKHGISGHAQAHFTFLENGKLDASSVNVKAESPYLRVYVHRLIERTFAGAPVPENLRKWKNSLELFCFVQFSIVESETAVSLDTPTSVMGNRLFFARKSSDGMNQMDKLKWKVGPLHGFFPVPAVGVDMLWFARQAAELRKKQALLMS